HGPYQIRSLGDRRRHPAEPDAGRQSLDRAELRRKTPVDEDETICCPRKSDRGELGAGRRADNRAHRACRKHRVLFERAQIEITPSLAATARKAELGKASEAPSAIPGEPVRLPGPSATIPTPERIEVRSRLGFDREIDDGTHRDYSAAVT